MIVGVKQHDILTYRIARLGAIFDAKLCPSLRAGQYDNGAFSSATHILLLSSNRPSDTH